MTLASSGPPGAISSIPYARTVVALDAGQFAALRRAVGLLFRVAHSEAYRSELDGRTDPVVRHDPGNFGVFMGYDFHLTDTGPRLIEINTNAGGAMLNGVHTASLCDPERLDGVCSGLLPVEELKERVVSTFREEFAAVRGRAAPLRSLAIADERPEAQFLAPEFELLRELFEKSGVRAEICDTAELARSADGGLMLGGSPIDLVYLRDTDFRLSSRRVAALREAYLADEVVVTPSPREHHLLADKRRLEIFSSRETLARLGVDSDDASFLAEVVPETRLLASMSADEAWSSRRDWVFKPAAAFGSRAVYRGDKISHRKLDEIYRGEDFVAQRRIAPGEIEVATSDGPQRMKFDVRAYAYRDQVLMLGARAYQGQVTNFRSPGGGFSAICVSRDAAGASPAED
jgi:hypothetical protein